MPAPHAAQRGRFEKGGRSRLRPHNIRIFRPCAACANGAKLFGSVRPTAHLGMVSRKTTVSHMNLAPARSPAPDLALRHRPARRPFVQVRQAPSHRALADPHRLRESSSTHLAIDPTARYAEPLLHLLATQQLAPQRLYHHRQHPLPLPPGSRFPPRPFRRGQGRRTISGHQEPCQQRRLGLFFKARQPPEREPPLDRRDRGEARRRPEARPMPYAQERRKQPPRGGITTMGAVPTVNSCPDGIVARPPMGDRRHAEEPGDLRL